MKWRILKNLYSLKNIALIFNLTQYDTNFQKYIHPVHISRLSGLKALGLSASSSMF